MAVTLPVPMLKPNKKMPGKKALISFLVFMAEL
jgi:hypothetical protein